MSKIMIQGTTSSAGKSMMVAALCRIFSNDGFRVVPFKSQNMSSKYYLLDGGKKISTAQALQAMAARMKPDVRMNPVLLIPSSDMGSEVIVNGESRGHMEARRYFEYKSSLRSEIQQVFCELEKLYDIVVIEGAGSPAEINLKENDIVNMGMAKMADSNVFLVADIDRGGVFASLYGTYMLFEPEERRRIKGFIINKFRGDKSLLTSGIEMIEDLTGIPVVGVIPYMHIELADEDSLVDYVKKCNTEVQTSEEMESELDRLAKVVSEHLDMKSVYSAMGCSDEFRR